MALGLKNLFMLKEDVIFLNHGSYGACPKKVFNTYQQWQRELEKQPHACSLLDTYRAYNHNGHETNIERVICHLRLVENL